MTAPGWGEPAGEPRPYPQLLRGPGFRWWRPLWSLAILLVTAAVLFAVLLVGVVGYAMVVPQPDGPSPVDDAQAWSATPEGLLATLLITACAIPAVMIATWGGFGRRPRWLASVVGGLRWGWLVRCGLVAVGVTVVPGLALTLAVDDVTSWTPEPRWPALLVVTVAGVPLQAAAEEYLFRGWLLQTVGAWFARPLAGALVGGVVSCLLFALAHGQQDPWLFTDRFLFGVIACWLVWRTGGLEAPIAFHIVNNLTVFGFTIMAGDLVDALSATEAGAAGVIADLVLTTIAASLIVALARHRRIERLFPPAQAQALA